MSQLGRFCPPFARPVFHTKHNVDLIMQGRDEKIYGGIDEWGFEASTVGLVCKVKIGKDEGGGGFEEILFRTQRNKNPKEGRKERD